MSVGTLNPPVKREGVEAGGRRVRRLLVTVAVLAALAASVIGVRALLAHRSVSVPTNEGLSMPTSAVVEGAWGIRVNSVDLLADGGLVEIRYVVVDPSKADRIHSGDVKQIPLIQIEGTGHQVGSASLMFHFHHGLTNTDGTSYSIIYGNAGGSITARSVVDVVFPDGSRLDRVPVG